MNNKNLLSPREIKILMYLSEGYSSKQLEAKLGITKNTIDTHRRNIIRKLKCSNITESVMKYLSDDIIMKQMKN